MQKYKIQEDFFDGLNPDSAYVLGLIYADGNVFRRLRGNSEELRLNITSKDLPLLRKVAALMKSTYPLKKNRECYGLTTNNKRLVSALVERGVMPRKSNILVWPQFPRRLYGAFIRGYFDGDGWASITCQKGLQIGFCSGSLNFITSLREALSPLVSKTTRVGNETAAIETVTNTGTVYKIRYNGQNAARVCEFMYSDADDLYMKRKRKPYEDWLKAEPDRDRWTPEQELYLREMYATAAREPLAAELGKSGDCVTRKAALLKLRKASRRCAICGNPDHLRTTCPENTDRKRRGQLRPFEVLRIRKLASNGHVSQNEIAKRLGVSPALVSLIVRRKAWRHI